MASTLETSSHLFLASKSKFCWGGLPKRSNVHEDSKRDTMVGHGEVLSLSSSFSSIIEMLNAVYCVAQVQEGIVQKRTVKILLWQIFGYWCFFQPISLDIWMSSKRTDLWSHFSDIEIWSKNGMWWSCWTDDQKLQKLGGIEVPELIIISTNIDIHHHTNRYSW